MRSLEDRPGLGLALGQRYRPTTFGIFGFAWISSPTLRDAMVLALRYLDLSFAFCTPTIELGADENVLQLADERVPADVRGFLVDRDLAAIFSVFDAQYLDQPLPQANSHTVELCEAQCRELVAATGAHRHRERCRRLHHPRGGRAHGDRSGRPRDGHEHP